MVETIIFELQARASMVVRGTRSGICATLGRTSSGATSNSTARRGAQQAEKPTAGTHLNQAGQRQGDYAGASKNYSRAVLITIV